MATTCTKVIPAELLPTIKTGLIAKGYSNQGRTIEETQSDYFRYMQINHLDLCPNIPFLDCLIPDELVSGGSENAVETGVDGFLTLEGETANVSLLTQIHQAFLDGLTNGYVNQSVDVSRLALLETQIRYELAMPYWNYGVKIMDQAIVESFDDTTYPAFPSAQLTKDVLGGFKITNLTDAYYDKLKSGEAEGTIFFKEVSGDMLQNDNELPWVEQSLNQNMNSIYKWGGAYWFVQPDNSLNVRRYMFKLNLDNTNTEYTESFPSGVGSWLGYVEQGI